MIDPQQDTDRFRAAADAAKVGIRYVLETHLHNDLRVQRERGAARRTGAELLLSAAAGAAFDHAPALP